MIASNELRKGNLIMWNEKVGRVTQILWNGIEIEMEEGDQMLYQVCEFDALAGIPVNLEILEKCDLVKHRRFYYAHVFYSKSGRFIINQLRDNIEISFAVNSSPGIISDKNLFLHQLQNMYFSLLQEELVVNL